MTMYLDSLDFNHHTTKTEKPSLGSITEDLDTHNGNVNGNNNKEFEEDK
ncbi:MAG: hypothetical protein ACP5OH_03475 [Nitrososphaerota archaeon]